MKQFQNIINKLKLLIRSKFAKKYGEYYTLCIHTVLTALFKVLKNADKAKVEPCINDAQMIIKEIRDFITNHKDFIKQTGKELMENMETGPADKKMKEIVKLLEPIFISK